MAKTIKQIAEELGVSKQAVFKRIDNLGLHSRLSKIDNQFIVNDVQENLIKSAFYKKEPSTKSSTVDINESSTKTELIDILVKQSETLKNELEVKNKQIEELNKRLEENQRLLDQQQKLHVIAEQKIQLLEHKEKGEFSSSENKGFLSRLFKR